MNRGKLFILGLGAIFLIYPLVCALAIHLDNPFSIAGSRGGPPQVGHLPLD